VIRSLTKAFRLVFKTSGVTLDFDAFIKASREFKDILFIVVSKGVKESEELGYERAKRAREDCKEIDSILYPMGKNREVTFSDSPTVQRNKRALTGQRSPMSPFTRRVHQTMRSPKMLHELSRSGPSVKKDFQTLSPRAMQGAEPSSDDLVEEIEIRISNGSNGKSDKNFILTKPILTLMFSFREKRSVNAGRIGSPCDECGA